MKHPSGKLGTRINNTINNSTHEYDFWSSLEFGGGSHGTIFSVCGSLVDSCAKKDKTYRTSISMRYPKFFHILWKNLRHHQFGHDQKFRRDTQNIRIYPSRSKKYKILNWLGLHQITVLKTIKLSQNWIFLYLKSDVSVWWRAGLFKRGRPGRNHYPKQTRDHPKKILSTSQGQNDGQARNFVVEIIFF